MKSIRARKHPELKPAELRWRCDPDIFEIDSTEELEPIEGILGQERALRAIRLGIDLKSPGYNIFIAGLSGTGKATTIKKVLERISTECNQLKDYAYVNNFKDTDRPRILVFEAGKAKEFKQDLTSVIDLLKIKIPQTLESEGYIKRRQQLIAKYSETEKTLMKDFEEKMSKINFALGQVKLGENVRADILPVVNGKPVPIFQLEQLVTEHQLSEDTAEEIAKNYNLHQAELQKLFRQSLKLSQEAHKKLEELEKSSVGAAVKGLIENLKEKYKSAPASDYLDQVSANIISNIHPFKGSKTEEETTPEGYIIDYFREYDVNIILDNSETKECPVIIETSPSYLNLFGTIEKVNDGKGGWYSDFTNIKAGSLLRANGGFLVLNVNHLFEEPGVWRNLKRVLTYRKLEIQDPYYSYQYSPSPMKPEAIEIDTKIILMGSQYLYSVLSEHEYDFKKIFKVKADFDYEIKRNDKVLIEYARVIKKFIKDENLFEFDKTAIAYLMEIAARETGNQFKLSTRFSKIADIAREASFWAKDDGFTVVNSAHVKKAYKYGMDRHGMMESKINEMLDNKTLLIDTKGERIGQINGLAIYNADFYSFGRPTRITSTVSLGSGSIINVEREAGMSGRHYNKGVLIISGYFRETFGQNLPLSFNANLVFEQSYGTVDGDSASCAEIFALLSTLSGLPIKQGIAVTGSLNQKGDVQPIGGVNEKIEGFFDVCAAEGLDKKQGVIIPIQNVKDLMLRDDVIEAVGRGEFHIYPIERVEEGMEILTGVKAGYPAKDNQYEPDTVFFLVEKKIKDLYAKARSLPNAVKGQVKKRRPR
jgi:lon-related putative ATP-dependent protease